MVVTAGIIEFEDLARVGARSIGDKHRVTGIARVEHHARTIGRPGDVHRVVAKKRARRAAHERHQSQPAIVRDRARQPDLGCVRRKADAAHWEEELLLSAARQVDEPSGTELRQPDVDLSVAIGPEHHELAVARDGCVGTRTPGNR